MGQSNQLERMLKLMKLDETTNKQNTNSSLEYVTEGADGKMYGVVREGTKYFIKNSDIKGKKLVSEDFNYVGGFMEKNHCKFNSYTDAVKNLDMKLMSIKESCNSTVQIVEATNPAFKAERKVRETETMGVEIARQRQIMERLEHLHEDAYMIKPKGEGFGGVGESDPFAKTKPEINKLQKEIGTEEEADETPLNDKGEPKAKAVGDADYEEVEKKPKSIMQPVIPVKEGIEFAEEEVDLDEPNLDDEDVLDVEDEPQIEDGLEQELDLDSEPLEDETCDGCDTDELLRMVLDRLENIETELTQEKYSDEDLYDGDEEEFEPQMSDVEPEPIGNSDEQDVEPQEEKFLENRIMKALHSTLIKEGFYDDDIEDNYVEMTDDDYRNLEIAKADKNKISKFVDKDIEDEFKDADADL